MAFTKFRCGIVNLLQQLEFCLVSRGVQDPGFRTRVRQDSAHFQQTGVKRNFWPLRNFWPVVV